MFLYVFITVIVINYSVLYWFPVLLLYGLPLLPDDKSIIHSLFPLCYFLLSPPVSSLLHTSWYILYTCVLEVDWLYYFSLDTHTFKMKPGMWKSWYYWSFWIRPQCLLIWDHHIYFQSSDYKRKVIEVSVPLSLHDLESIQYFVYWSTVYFFSVWSVLFVYSSFTTASPWSERIMECFHHYW